MSYFYYSDIPLYNPPNASKKSSRNNILSQNPNKAQKSSKGNIDVYHNKLELH